MIYNIEEKHYKVHALPTENFSCMQATCSTCRLLGLLVHSWVPLVATSSGDNNPTQIRNKKGKKKNMGRCKKIGVEQKQKQPKKKKKKLQLINFWKNKVFIIVLFLVQRVVFWEQIRIGFTTWFWFWIAIL